VTIHVTLYHKSYESKLTLCFVKGISVGKRQEVK
jgi:hypothetical protein